MSEDDRRSHIRIRDQILLYYQPISETEYRETVKSYREGTATPWSRCAHPYFSSNIQGGLKRLRERDDALADVLGLLDEKLTMLLNLIDAKANTGSPARPHEVDLSAAGLAFPSPEAMAPGQILEMDIGLLPSHYFFHCFGEVNRSEPDTGNRNKIAARFVWLTENDRERLIEHIFQHQVLQLRLRRQGQDEP